MLASIVFRNASMLVIIFSELPATITSKTLATINLKSPYRLSVKGTQTEGFARIVGKTNLGATKLLCRKVARNEFRFSKPAPAAIPIFDETHKRRLPNDETLICPAFPLKSALKRRFIRKTPMSANN